MTGWRGCTVVFQIVVYLSVWFAFSILCRLADQGHVVVGVEVAEMAIKDFFNENGVEFSVGPVDSLKDAELYSVGFYNSCLYREKKSYQWLQIFLYYKKSSIVIKSRRVNNDSKISMQVKF